MPNLNPQDVVAFLQNPWFKPDTKPETIEKYRTDVQFRRMLLAQTTTGERLAQAFGDWFFQIHWDNANPRHGAHPSAAYKADVEHMAGVIQQKTPLMVITFGNIATVGWKFLLTVPGAGSYYKTITHMSFRHPMAYGVSVNQLMEFAMRIQLSTT